MALEAATYISQLVSANPAGGDDADTADDHLRLLKEVLLNTLGTLNAAVTATADELNILNGCVLTTAQLNLFANIQALASNDDIIDNFPAGTVMLFQQTSAPTGWTKVTTHNDKALRVVSGTAGSGGGDAFSTVFNTGKVSDSHILTIAEIPSHDHGGVTSTDGAHTHSGGVVGGTDILGGTPGYASGATGSAGNHSHTISSQGGGGGHTHVIDNMDVQYIDVILASKA